MPPASVSVSLAPRRSLPFVRLILLKSLSSTTVGACCPIFSVCDVIFSEFTFRDFTLHFFPRFFPRFFPISLHDVTSTGSKKKREEKRREEKREREEEGKRKERSQSFARARARPRSCVSEVTEGKESFSCLFRKKKNFFFFSFSFSQFFSFFISHFHLFHK